MTTLPGFLEYLSRNDPELLVEMPDSKDLRRIWNPVAKLLNDPETGDEPQFTEGWEGRIWIDMIKAAKRTDVFKAWAVNLSRAGDERFLRFAGRALLKYLAGISEEREYEDQSKSDSVTHLLSRVAYAIGVRHLYGKVLSDYAGVDDSEVATSGANQYALMRRYITNTLKSKKMAEEQAEAIANGVINKWLTGTYDTSPPAIDQVHPISIATPSNSRNLRIVMTENPVIPMRAHLIKIGAKRAAREGFLSRGGTAEARRGNEVETRVPRTTAKMATIGVESKYTGKEGSRRGEATGGFYINHRKLSNIAMIYFQNHLSDMGQELRGVGEYKTVIGKDQILDLLEKKLRTPVELGDGEESIIEPLVSDEVWDIIQNKFDSIFNVVKHGIRGSVGTSQCIPILNPDRKDAGSMYPFLQFATQVLAKILVHASGAAHRKARTAADYLTILPLLYTVTQEYAYQVAALPSWYNSDCRYAKFTASTSGSPDKGSIQVASGGRTHVQDVDDEDEWGNWEKIAPDEDEAAIGRIKARQIGMYHAFTAEVELAGIKALERDPALMAEYRALLDKQKRSARDDAKPSDEMKPAESARLMDIVKHIEQLGLVALVTDPETRRKWIDVLELIPSVSSLLTKYISDDDTGSNDDDSNEFYGRTFAQRTVANPPLPHDEDGNEDEDDPPASPARIRKPPSPRTPSTLVNPTDRMPDSRTKAAGPKPIKPSSGTRRGTKRGNQSKFATTASFSGASTMTPERRREVLSYYRDHNESPYWSFADFLKWKGND